MHFDNRVQRYGHTFTKTDKQIVQYIKQHPFGDAFSTIKSLAHAIGTSPSTLTRFSDKLHYHNFQDMKFHLQREMTETKIANTPLIQRMYTYYQNIIKQTSEFISDEDIHAFVSQLKRSRQVHYAGLGSSGLTATECYYRTIRTGLKSSVATDAHQMKINATLLSQSDTFVAISNSGETDALIDAAALAQKEGAYVVAITNYRGSRLTRYADKVLITTDQYRNEDRRFINSQIAPIFLLDIVSYLLLEDTYMFDIYEKTRHMILEQKD